MKSIAVSLFIAAFCQAADPPKEELRAGVSPILMPPQSLERPASGSGFSRSGTPLLLTKDFQYVFESDVPVVVKIIPEGLVTMTTDEGPLRMKGFWADLPDAKEKTLRKFNKKFVYELIPAGTGQITVLVIPIGFKDEKEIVQRSVDVNARGPPTPDTHLTEFQKKLLAAFNEDVTNGATVENAKKLSALYRNAATTTVMDAGLTSTKQLFDEMGRAVQSLKIPHGSMDNTVRLLVDTLASNLPKTESLPLGPAQRKLIASDFIQMAAALEILK